ncbi:DNA replication ATP-dependent helicase/nuclease DNA2 [Vitis vinifera]|uniref:DNA replication ATP-dependent helicase/nuclease DNA2 n=1 Tax=Vitis vinifera TaxID=29760 RepID=A0A438J0F3_VITVI|nr:DNA replication ATP-dependent helicase/nuclease DNA2 [Vitis vinifera]
MMENTSLARNIQVPLISSSIEFLSHTIIIGVSFILGSKLRIAFTRHSKVNLVETSKASGIARIIRAAQTRNSLMAMKAKALLELLDQVEDAISVEESVSSDGEACLSKVQCINGDEMPLRVDPALKIPEMGPTEKVNGECFNIIFLVLEVSEKREYADLSGAQCPSKVLRLLNEKTGEEQAVYLRDEWFYSVIAPGDTIHVIGKFDDQGKCDVDHDNNFLIVHPDILVSGTRVAASFSCSRRTVLDERLKCSEHSTAALIGTLLHQIFQAGLIREIPTKVFLEEYARIVVQKNLESLYACGVNEDDMYKTLIEATPRILNWIILFKNSQEYRGATVDFGSDDGLKRVNVSESAMEHTAQVILYTLLMSERYLKPIDSGLLYYLNTDHTQGIAVKRSDLVGLIMRRNELAKDILKASMMQQLPPMLQSPSMCKSCRHLNACTIYHKELANHTHNTGYIRLRFSLVTLVDINIDAREGTPL